MAPVETDNLADGSWSRSRQCVGTTKYMQYMQYSTVCTMYVKVQPAGTLLYRSSAAKSPEEALFCRSQTPSFVGRLATEGTP